MQRADVVLSILREKSINEKFVFSRFYRYLYNYDFYSGKNKLKIIELLKNERFYPQKSCEISKEIEMALAKILDTIFIDKALSLCEGDLNDSNGRIQFLRQKFNNVNNIIQGKFKDTNSPEFNFLIKKLIMSKISDGRFIELIDRFLMLLDNFSILKDKLYNLIYEYYRNRYSLFIMDNSTFLIGLAENISINDLILDELSNDIFIIKEELQLKSLKMASINMFGYSICIREGKIYFETTDLVIQKSTLKYFSSNNIMHIGHICNRSNEYIINYFNEDFRLFKQKTVYSSNFSSAIKKFRYYNYKCLLKTLAFKEKTSIRSIIKKYGVEIKRDFKNSRIVIKCGKYRYIGFDS